MEVVYGFASTAFTFIKGDEESLVRWGIADDEMIKFLENDVVSQLMHIIDTPLHELGKETMIGEHCECDRQQCVACWIQKKS